MIARALRRAALLPLLLAVPAAAQDRPSEEELFGAPPAAPPPAASPQAPEPGPPQEPPAAAAETPPGRLLGGGKGEVPLSFGGTLYARSLVAWQEGVPPADWQLALPSLLDLWADARPNDRVRGFVLARTTYDPTAGAGLSGAYSGLGQPGEATTAAAPAETTVVLDQLWVNFDVARTVFVTAGKQHTKWGAGRFWNPTDWLHPIRRDPLSVYDVREGVPIVKAHLPWEARGWNLYGAAMFADVAGSGARVGRLGAVAGAGRAEIVLGTAEIGADAVAQDGRKPRYGVDVSAGVWDLDLYAEAALRPGADAPRLVADPAAPLGYRAEPVAGYTPQITAGGSWSWKYSDEDSLTLGAEYFYNDAGYGSARIYPALLVATMASDAALEAAGIPRARYFDPFYVGRHYAAAFLSLPSPGSWNDTTFTLSVLGNLSDRSFVARLDHSVLVLTYLRVETFVSGHLGAKGGELRFAVPPTVVPDPTPTDPTRTSVFEVKAPVLEAGLALRVNL
jgi:hypothetical protein